MKVNKVSNKRQDKVCSLRGKLQFTDHRDCDVFGLFSLLFLGHTDGVFESHSAYGCIFCVSSVLLLILCRLIVCDGPNSPPGNIPNVNLSDTEAPGMSQTSLTSIVSEIYR